MKRLKVEYKPRRGHKWGDKPVVVTIGADAARLTVTEADALLLMLGPVIREAKADAAKADAQPKTGPAA